MNKDLSVFTFLGEIQDIEGTQCVVPKCYIVSAVNVNIP